MDDLKSLLINRATEPQAPQALASGSPPPTIPNKVPPRWQRWANAQQMIAGYQNDWNPNPVLTQLLDKRG
jgi:hypothetical protein